MTVQKSTKTREGIILFDGVCNLCNSSVDFIIRRDKYSVFKFTSLQSEIGQELLHRYQISGKNMDSVVLVMNQRHFIQSTAALMIARYLVFPWNLMYIFIIVPPFIRNTIYNFIARNRYKFFGKKDTCRLPSPEERSRFL